MSPVATLAAWIEAMGSDFVAVSLSVAGVITSWNLGAERAWDYVAADVLGRSVVDLVDHAERDECAERLRRAAEGVATAGVITCIRKDGVATRLASRMAPVRDLGGIARIVLLARDLDTEHPEGAGAGAGDESNRLLDSVVALEVTARRQICRDIHDGLGQVLTTAALWVGAAREGPLARDAVLLRVGALLDEAIAATRGLMAQLWLPDIEPLGLASSLRGLVERVQRPGFDVDLQVVTRQEPRPPAFAFAVYGIAQQALAEAAKQHASSASVVVVDRGDELVVVVEDDGDSREATPAVAARADDDWATAGGLGGIAEIVAAFGGVLTLERRSPTGTTVRVVIPPLRA